MASATHQYLPLHLGLALTDDLMRAAFEKLRDPRSDAYKLGARAPLTNRASGVQFRCPFEMGTAEADAFYAGAEEGRMIWQGYVSAQGNGGSTVGEIC